MGERARQIEVFRERTCPWTANTCLPSNRPRSIRSCSLGSRFTLHAILAISSAPRTHLKSPIYWARELLIFLPYKGVGEENTWKHKEKEEGLVSLSSNVERIEDECNLSGSGFGEGEGDWRGWKKEKDGRMVVYLVVRRFWASLSYLQNFENVLRLFEEACLC